MNGSGKQSYYEIQLSNGSLIVAFLVAVAIGVTVFVLGVMVGRGQAPQALPETQFVEALPGGDEFAPAEPMETVDNPVESLEGDIQPADADADSAADSTAGAPTAGDLAEAAPPVAAANAQPTAPAGLPRNDPSLASGWVVQVESIPDETAARELQAALSLSGFPTFVVKADVRGEEMFRVRVGRYADKADAEEVAAALGRRTDITATWVTQG